MQEYEIVVSPKKPQSYHVKANSEFDAILKVINKMAEEPVIAKNYNFEVKSKLMAV